MKLFWFVITLMTLDTHDTHDTHDTKKDCALPYKKLNKIILVSNLIRIFVAEKRKKTKIL